MKCPGSHEEVMLSWLPSTHKDYAGNPGSYPGGAICLRCSLGLQVLVGSVHEGVSVAGEEGLFGKLPIHGKDE